MKLQRTTWILLGIALLSAGTVWVTELRRSPTSDDPAVSTSELGTDLFTFEEEQIQALTVKTSSQRLSFQKDQNGDWRMTAPESTLASEGTVVYLLNLLVTSTAENPTEIAPNQKGDFGLESPFATIEVTLDNQETHSLVVGNMNFDGTSRYAIAMSPATVAESDEKLTIVLVPNTFASAIDRPLEDWQQIEIPAPTPQPSAEPSPAAESPEEPEANDSESPEGSETEDAVDDQDDNEFGDFQSTPQPTNESEVDEPESVAPPAEDREPSSSEDPASDRAAERESAN